MRSRETVIQKINSDYFLNSIGQFIFVMDKHCIFFAVQAKVLKIVYMPFLFQKVKLPLHCAYSTVTLAHDIAVLACHCSNII